MKDLTKIFIVFLCITGGATIMMNVLDITFGTDNYWDVRGVFFLFFVTLFPRLTLLFSSVASGGVLWWLAWLISPRFLVAFLATVAYWQSNPILVLISWLVALGGETSEKNVFINRGRSGVMRFKRTVNIHTDTGDTFEADYTVKRD